MSNAYVLSVLMAGMALLLFPGQATRNAEEPVVRPMHQGKQHAVHVDVHGDQPDTGETDVDFEKDIELAADLNIDIDEAHIVLDQDERDVDADFDVEDIGDHEAVWTEHEQEKIEKTFAMPAGTGRRTLEIDNVWGSIEVVGTASEETRLTVNKSIRAESKSKVEQARKDVTLDVTQRGAALKLYVNGPFRCNCRDCGRSRDDEDRKSVV